MEIVEAVRDVNPEAVKCVVCGALAEHYMDSKQTQMPVCANQVCEGIIVEGINKLLVAWKNRGLEVAA